MRKVLNGTSSFGGSITLSSRKQTNRREKAAAFMSCTRVLSHHMKQDAAVASHRASLPDVLNLTPNVCTQAGKKAMGAEASTATESLQMFDPVHSGHPATS